MENKIIGARDYHNVGTHLRIFLKILATGKMIFPIFRLAYRMRIPSLSRFSFLEEESFTHLSYKARSYTSLLDASCNSFEFCLCEKPRRPANESREF